VECAHCRSEVPAGAGICPGCGKAPPPDRARFARLNAIFSGRYDFLGLLGSGGFAEVFLAQDVLLEREVAVKILLPQHAQDPQTVERFLREARLYAKLEHPNIIPVYDTGVLQGNVFITMKYVRGESLKQVLAARKRIDLAQLPAIAGGVAQALAYIHRQGIVHRDIKPANIIIEKATNTVYLADFGIARAASSQTLTQTGMIVGTPHYLAPEQIQGKKIDARSDIYALGATLYELASGQPPFHGDSPLEILYQHINESAAPLSRLVPGIDPDLERIIAKCIAKDPARRFQKAEEVAASLAPRPQPQDLERTLLTSAAVPRNGRRGARALMVAGSVLALAVAAYFLWLRPTGAPRTPAGPGLPAASPPQQPARGLAPSRDPERAPGAVSGDRGAAVEPGPEQARPALAAGEGAQASGSRSSARLPAAKPVVAGSPKPSPADPGPGTVRFSSFPPAADVYLRGEKLGSTEQMFEKRFPPGDYAFQFTIPGYQSAEVGVAVVAGEVVSAHRRFPPFRSFTVTARPFGRVQIDGKEYGDTPQTVKLAFGEHRVRVTKPGYRMGEQTVVIAPQAKNSIHFELTKEE
jgi:serine/threonine-protein kinase